MKNPLNDIVTKWTPADRAARLIIRPAFDDEKLNLRGKTLLRNPGLDARAILALEEDFLKSGDRLGRLTFLGITVTGRAFCRCDCGRFDSFEMIQVVHALKAKKFDRLSCCECLALWKAMKAAQK